MYDTSLCIQNTRGQSAFNLHSDAMRASVGKMLLVCSIAWRMLDPECLCSEVSTNAWGVGCRPAADAARAGGREDPRVPGWPLAHKARRQRLQDGSLIRRAPAAGGGREHLPRGAGSGCGDGDDQKSHFCSFVSGCICLPHLIRAACVTVHLVAVSHLGMSGLGCSHSLLGASQLQAHGGVR